MMPALDLPSQSEMEEEAQAKDARAVRRWLIIALFASIFLQRFALPIGPEGIAFNLLVTMLALAVLICRGSLLLDPVRTVFFFALATVASLSAAVNAGLASLPSLALFLIMYAPFMFSLQKTEGVLESCVRAFQVMVLVLAVFGILQFVAQFVIGTSIPFTFKGIVPDWMLVSKFNTANPLSWDSPYFKSNGFFLVEPSTFSQYLAIAIVLELLFFGATWRLLVFGLALPTSYSGTGLILLLFILPWLMLYRRAYGAIVGALAFAVLAIFTGSLWNADALFSRISEFGSEGSSANARFIAATWLIGSFQMHSASDVFFGLGPGSYAQHAAIVPYEAHDPVWAKMLFEYGVLGSMVFWPFFLIAIFRSSPSRWISWSILIGFFTFGGMLLDPRYQVLMLLFCVLPKRPVSAPVTSQPDWAASPLHIRPAQ